MTRSESYYSDRAKMFAQLQFLGRRRQKMFQGFVMA